MNNIMFSIVIPAYNETKHIQECIESIRKNDKSIPYEICVVDNGSTDGTVELAKALSVKIIENIEGNIGALRNYGARLSNGNILVFLDADMVVPDNWLQKAKEYYTNGFEGALGFVDRVPSSAGWVGKIWDKRLNLERNKVMNVDLLPGRNIFVNRHVFEKTNGFSETLITAEDKDFTFRISKAGFRVISIPGINVVHLGYDKNLWTFIKKEFWRQGDTLQFARKWGYSLRALNNPILSFYHIAMLFLVILTFIFIGEDFASILVFIWILPSLTIVFAKVGFREGFTFLLLLFILTFLRWNVSGVSLIGQIAKGISFRSGDRII